MVKVNRLNYHNTCAAQLKKPTKNKNTGQIRSTCSGIPMLHSKYCKRHAHLETGSSRTGVSAAATQYNVNKVLGRKIANMSMSEHPTVSKSALRRKHLNEINAALTRRHYIRDATRAKYRSRGLLVHNLISNNNSNISKVQQKIHEANQSITKTRTEFTNLLKKLKNQKIANGVNGSSLNNSIKEVMLAFNKSEANHKKSMNLMQKQLQKLVRLKSTSRISKAGTSKTRFAPKQRPRKAKSIRSNNSNSEFDNEFEKLVAKSKKPNKPSRASPIRSPPKSRKERKMTHAERDLIKFAGGNYYRPRGNPNAPFQTYLPGNGRGAADKLPLSNLNIQNSNSDNNYFDRLV